MVRVIKAGSIIALVAALSGCLFPPPGGGGGGGWGGGHGGGILGRGGGHCQIDGLAACEGGQANYQAEGGHAFHVQFLVRGGTRSPSPSDSAST